MSRTYLAIAAAGAMLLSGPAFAKDATVAQLSAITGAVNVSQNGKLSPAKAGALKVGDRVVAANGAATLSYADGCVVALKAQSMATVAAASPCATGAGLVTAGSTSAQIGDLTAVQLVAGTLAVGGLIYGIASVVDGGSDTTVSP